MSAGHLYQPGLGGAVLDGDGDWLPVFSGLTRGREVVVLLHGYNVTRKEGWNSLLGYMGLLKARGVGGLLLAVLWPGDGWAKALTYPFVAHSLGSRVAMETAQRLADGVGRRKRALGRICLMAPALDNDGLGRAGRACYRSGTLAAERVAVLASEEDLVLRFAYPLGDLGQSVLFGERWGTALGRTGPFEPDGPTSTKLERVPLSKASADVDHGDYLHLDRPPAGTLSASEEFVAGFLNRTPPYRGPSSR